MEFYQDHPARKRAQTTPRAKTFPKEINAWCRHIPAEDKGTYPIDQSDGGEDDDPAEHKAWAEKLKTMGRNPRAPWKRQTDKLTIDPDRDVISDGGEEIWSVLAARGIDRIMLVGVHTNMCVLGRPFGLRQMARNGKTVVLVRDLTDTMYNPERAPFVSHFTGTDLIVEHIEKFVCPTITSDQLLGGKPLRFSGDRRPHVAIVTAEDEYQTEKSLPEFALKHLGKTCRVSFVFANDKQRYDLPGLDVLNDADVALISVRRRPLPAAQLAIVRRFVADGKAVVGIRTASHAFAPPLGKTVPECDAWPEFDRDVLGGNYTGHHGEGTRPTITVAPVGAKHPILDGVKVSELRGGGSLYKVRPLAKTATPLLIGAIPGKPAEPVAWVNRSTAGGRAFYTSLGHVDDFQQPAFAALLRNAVLWAADAKATTSKK
ncbi:MAG: isochorismatase family protein [Gemmataceae bacterium]